MNVSFIFRTFRSIFEFLATYETPFDPKKGQKKLFNLGIRDRELLWFQDYLSNRKQFVFINGQNSYIKRISIGVPQGCLNGIFCC